MLLYCETLLQNLLGVYCKRFYWILLFTMLLLFYVFEVGKARSATQSVLNNISTEWTILEKFLSFLLYSWKFHILNPPPLPPLFFFHYSVCTVIFDWNHIFDISTFSIQFHKNTFIAIENTYLSGGFLKSKIYIFP